MHDSPSMRFLILSPNTLSPRAGAAKVLLELADALRTCGASVELLGPEQLGQARRLDRISWRQYAQAARSAIKSRAAAYDVVEYDHESLPFDRSEFDSSPVLVARSVLLVHHLEEIRWPARTGFRSIVGRLVRGRSRRELEQLRLADATRTIGQADLVNVSNRDDKALLVRRHLCDAQRVLVLPFGLSRARRARFERHCRPSPPPEPVVAFVGTIDWRKGAADFPRLVGAVCGSTPAARFRLLGTRGLMRTARDVYACFPRSLRGRLEVVPEFDPDELPALLGDCAVGVFPSYLEGFGFGVLEMLAAAIPVIAYDAPGPPMMLGRDWLVRPADVGAMSSRVTALLRDRDALAGARVAARLASAPFDWERIARATMDAYSAHLRARAAGTTA